MNRTFTLCFSLYPIALPFGYVLIYTFYHYAVPDANSNLGYLGEIREVYLSTAITPQSGQTYTIGSLSLETGKWLLFGATLAGGDLIID